MPSALQFLLAKGEAHASIGTTVPPDSVVGALVNRFAAQGIEVVPVTKHGYLVGILTRSDIIRLLLEGAADRPAPQGQA